MTVDDIITCMAIVSHYNPNMQSLHDTFVEEKPKMAASTAAVTVAFEDSGIPVYETLVKVQKNLANAVHDFIYNVIHPHEGIQTKNVIREQTCRELFGIEAHF